uniref:Uncharacterized protein n=1 Tax=viral metagenome TaxID=1070528 RepID=A0A6M3XRY6_9ZZZZ
MYIYSYERRYEPLSEGQPIPISSWLVRENLETGKKERRPLYAYGLRPPGPWEIMKND